MIEIVCIIECDGMQRNKVGRESNGQSNSLVMKGTEVQTLGGRAGAGAWLVAWAIMAMGAIINTHAHR